MNAIVAQMLGEADHHSPEELAQLKGAGGHEEQSGSAEESKEVQLANQILAAAKAQDYDTGIQAASELIRMHHAPTAASYRKQLSLSMMALPQSSSAPSSP
jgi:hypothetical protein